MYFTYLTSRAVETGTFLSLALCDYTRLLGPYVLWDRQDNVTPNETSINMHDIEQGWPTRGPPSPEWFR
jgi:hypothetical protein